jgi:hypothetical protein
MALSVKFYRNFGSRSEELWDYFLNGSNYFFHFAAMARSTLQQAAFSRWLATLAAHCAFAHRSALLARAVTAKKKKPTSIKNLGKTKAPLPY